MKQVTNFDLELFPISVVFSYGNRRHITEVKKKIKSIKNKNIPKECLETYLEYFDENTSRFEGFAQDINGVIFIWVNNKPSFQTAGIFIHEISHATLFIFDRLGMKHTQENDEVYSYLCEYIYKKIVNA